MSRTLGTLSALALFGMQPNAFFGGRQRVLFDLEEKDTGGGGDGTDDKDKEKDKEKDKGAEDKNKDKDKGKNKTQADIDRAVAEERRKQKATNDELLKSVNLSKEERATIEARNEELAKALEQKDELTKAEKNELVDNHKKELVKKDATIDFWQGEYRKALITQQIAEACVKFGVKNPVQMRSMLEHQAKLVQAKDAALNVIKGKYEIVIPHTSKVDGKDITKDVSIASKIEAMAGNEEDKNLFTSNRVSGTGKNGASGNNNQGGVDVPAHTKIGRGLAALG